MANQGAKRQVENNRKKLHLLQQVAFVATVYFAVCMAAEFYICQLGASQLF